MEEAICRLLKNFTEKKANPWSITQNIPFTQRTCQNTRKFYNVVKILRSGGVYSLEKLFSI